MRAFPTYDHDKGFCFYCDLPFDVEPHREEAFPPGRGQFSKRCSACGYRTYYDLPAAAPDNAQQNRK